MMLVIPRKRYMILDMLECIDMVTLSRYSVVNILAPVDLHKTDSSVFKKSYKLGVN